MAPWGRRLGRDQRTLEIQKSQVMSRKNAESYLAKNPSIKNLMEHPIQKKTKDHVCFGFTNQRFKPDRKVSIITGQEPESGNMYIIKDDKSNLGPGYYYGRRDDIENHHCLLK